MTINEILEGNKVIAEFMGYKPTEKKTGEPTYTHKRMGKGTVMWLGQFRYSESWDLQIPVWVKLYEKVRERFVGTLKLEIDNIAIKEFMLLKEKAQASMMLSDDKVTAFGLLVEAIQAYNSYQK